MGAGAAYQLGVLWWSLWRSSWPTAVDGLSNPLHGAGQHITGNRGYDNGHGAVRLCTCSTVPAYFSQASFSGAYVRAA